MVKRHKRKRNLKISKHKASGRWSFKTPARYSNTGKRGELYFPTKKKAEDKLAEIQAQYRETGRSVITATDKAAVTIINAKYGGFRRALTALDYYEKTVAKIRSIPLRDAVAAYIKRRASEKKAGGETKLDGDTINDIKYRLRAFVEYIESTIGHTPLDQIAPRDIDAFLVTRGDARSFWKQLSPFFKYAAMQDWILKNPLERVNMPEWNEAPREIYTPEQYSKLLLAARDAGDEEVLRLLVLNGAGFLRFEELVRKEKNDEVLLWEDLQLDRRFINVRKEVAKATRRAGGDAREIPTPETKSLYAWLHQHTNGRSLTGRIIPFTNGYFRKTRLKRIFELAGVAPVTNGLRHSCISYYLAMHPTVGVTEVARWSGNTEATIRKHYLRHVRPEEGAAWFRAVDRLIN
jgi:hypothetical protein